MTLDLVVAGAGPAGLTAAKRAAERGLSVSVVEAASAVGGLAGSFAVAGVRVDHGSHRLHPAADPRVLAEIRSVLGPDLQIRPRNGRIRLAGRWVSFPLRASDLVRRLPPGFAARAARDALGAPLRRRDGATFADVVRARFGPTVADAFYRPYVTKLWGRPPERLSADLARRRVGAGSALSAVRRDKGVFLYPRLGFGQISERLAEAATDAGATIDLGSPVTVVRPVPDGVSVDAGGTTRTARRLFSTVPLARLSALWDPPVPPPVAAAAGGIVHRGLALVYLALDESQYTPYDAHYFPETAVRTARLSEPKNYRDGPDPADRTVLCAEVPVTEGDETWQATDADLAGTVVDDLARVGLPAVTPVDVVVRRVARVYPVSTPAAAWAQARVEAWLAGHDRVLSFGRQGSFVPDNTHHVMAMGLAAADAVGSDDRFDAPAWSAARTRFRSHVVED